MTNGKKSKRNPRRANPAAAKNTKRNPFISRRRRNFKRNPAVAGYQPMQIVKLGAGAAAGAIATRAITQVVLKDNNSGVMGYAANVVAALGLGWLGAKVSPEFGLGLIAGGLGSTMQRVWNERVSKTSPAATPQLAGLGDADYSDNGLGQYVNGTWPAAQIGGSYVPALPAAAGAAAPIAPATVAEPARYARF